MPYEVKFLEALLWTTLIEVPIVFVLARYVFGNRKEKWYRLIFVAFIASVLTLPYLWFVLETFIHGSLFLWVGEISVTVFEGIMYFLLLQMRIDKAMAVSIIANLVSFLIGVYIL